MGRTKRSFPLSEASVERLLAAIAKLAGEDDEWMAPSRWPGLDIVPAVGRTKRAVYVTKLQGLCGFDLERAVRDRGLAIVSRFWPPPREAVEVIARACPVRSIDFVGDLDPLDLATYLTLASRLARFDIRLRYVGIDEEWLDTCVQMALPSTNRGQNVLPTIAMPRFEREVFALLQKLPLDWSETIGPKPFALLENGVKLELEGATNPAFYRAGLTNALYARLFTAR